MEQRGKAGSSLVDKSLQFVHIIKQSSENLTILLHSALITLFLLFHRILRFSEKTY